MISHERCEELVDMALEVILNTEFFHPVIWADVLKDGKITIEELYWMRDNIEVELELFYEGDGE